MANDRRELLSDLGAAIRAELEGFQAGLWTALPGYVTKYDPAKLTCEVQPTIKAKVLQSDGTSEWVTLPLLVDCPVMFPGGGRYIMTFPIQEGDECLVLFSSRCIDSWWQSGGVQIQAELRMHSLSDGFVLVGPRSQPKAQQVHPAPSTTKAEIRSLDGTAHISMDENRNIAIVGNTDVNIQCPNIRLSGDVAIQGSLSVSGAGTFVDEVTGAGITLSHHQHGGVSNGNSKTGPPVNFP